MIFEAIKTNFEAIKMIFEIIKTLHAAVKTLCAPVKTLRIPVKTLHTAVKTLRNTVKMIFEAGLPVCAPGGVKGKRTLSRKEQNLISRSPAKTVMIRQRSHAAAII